MKDRTRSAIIISTIIASFITPFIGSATNVAVPAMSLEFSMNAVLTSWIATSFTLSTAIFLVPLGKIADIKGRKKIFLLGLLVFVVSSILTGFSFSGEFLIAVRTLQGAGAAMIFSTSMAIITSVIEPKKRGKIIGYLIATVYAGLAMGPFAGGFIIQYLGWRSIFWLAALLGVICLYFIKYQIKGEWAVAPQDKFDWKGSLLYSISLLIFMLGLSKLKDDFGIILIVSGSVGLLVFVFNQLRADYPVLNVRLFRNNLTFSMSNLAALINYSSTSAVTLLMSFYLQYIKGLTPKDAGLIMIAQPIMMAVFSPISGRLSDFIESRIIASVGMFLSFIGLILLSLMNEQTTYFYLISNLSLLGLGFALFSSPNTNAIMSSVEPKNYGIASSTTATMRNIGQMLSMGLATLLISIFVGNVQISAIYHQQLMSAIKVNMLIVAVLCFLGIFTSLARGKHL